MTAMTQMMMQTLCASGEQCHSGLIDAKRLHAHGLIFDRACIWQDAAKHTADRCTQTETCAKRGSVDASTNQHPCHAATCGSDTIATKQIAIKNIQRLTADGRQITAHRFIIKTILR